MDFLKGIHVFIYRLQKKKKKLRRHIQLYSFRALLIPFKPKLLLEYLSKTINCRQVRIVPISLFFVNVVDKIDHYSINICITDTVEFTIGLFFLPSKLLIFLFLCIY